MYFDSCKQVAKMQGVFFVELYLNSRRLGSGFIKGDVSTSVRDGLRGDVVTSVRDDDLCEQVTMMKPKFELESEYQADYWLVGTSNFVED